MNRIFWVTIANVCVVGLAAAPGLSAPNGGGRPQAKPVSRGPAPRQAPAHLPAAQHAKPAVSHAASQKPAVKAPVATPSRPSAQPASTPSRSSSSPAYSNKPLTGNTRADFSPKLGGSLPNGGKLPSASATYSAGMTKPSGTGTAAARPTSKPTTAGAVSGNKAGMAQAKAPVTSRSSGGNVPEHLAPADPHPTGNGGTRSTDFSGGAKPITGGNRIEPVVISGKEALRQIISGSGGRANLIRGADGKLHIPVPSYQYGSNIYGGSWEPKQIQDATGRTVTVIDVTKPVAIAQADPGSGPDVPAQQGSLAATGSLGQQAAAQASQALATAPTTPATPDGPAATQSASQPGAVPSPAAQPSSPSSAHLGHRMLSKTLEVLRNGTPERQKKLRDEINKTAPQIAGARNEFALAQLLGGDEDAVVNQTRNATGLNEAAVRLLLGMTDDDWNAFSSLGTE